ncbi:diguanylate cyclase [Babesia caballi]|uniref:Diguanylate cyclase n=1 Tax=Babesia caballi TaxID=5871 RepID=A0AAV4LTQ9_BABCB|nr:diguanylate cyclase [Babesia caballi]
MAPKNRKVLSVCFTTRIPLQKATDVSEGVVTVYPLKYMAFDVIRDVTFVEDKSILEQHGIPLPPPTLNIAINKRQTGIYNLVKQVLVSYEDALVDAVTRVTSDKFDKRKTMFNKLIAAVTIRWYTVYRWKTHDRMLLKQVNATAYNIYKKQLNNEGYERGKRNHDKAFFTSEVLNYSGVKIVQTCENLHVYQILWQEHCQTMKMLLEEWNEAKDVVDKYGLPETTDAYYEVTDVMDRLNEMIRGVNSELHSEFNQEEREKVSLKSLLMGAHRDAEGQVTCGTDHVEAVKKQKTNEFQTMISLGINNFEKVLASLSLQFNNLVRYSSPMICTCRHNSQGCCPTGSSREESR